MTVAVSLDAQFLEKPQRDRFALPIRESCERSFRISCSVIEVLRRAAATSLTRCRCRLCGRCARRISRTTFNAIDSDHVSELALTAERRELLQEPKRRFLRRVGGTVAVAAKLAEAEAEPDVLQRGQQPRLGGRSPRRAASIVSASATRLSRPVL